MRTGEGIAEPAGGGEDRGLKPRRRHRATGVPTEPPRRGPIEQYRYTSSFRQSNRWRPEARVPAEVAASRIELPELAWRFSADWSRPGRRAGSVPSARACVSVVERADGAGH